MWIYLLIGLLFLILAVEGYFKGGVNGVITLLGVIIAINFSGAFGGFAYGWLADKWPIGDFPFWHRVVPTVAGFITIALLFAIAGLVVSIIIRKRLADRWDEFQIDSYKRMNRKFGLCTGLITATVYSVLMLAIIYRLGNFTVPLHQPGEGGDEGMLAMLNESRVQLDDTPFLKVAAAYDNTPELHYEVRDALLMIWNDRGKEMQDLMNAYPGFYALRGDSEIKALIGDSEDDSSDDSSSDFEDDTGSTDDSGDESLYQMWKSEDSLTLENILSNSDVVSAVNNRYEELKSIEPGSEEAKKLRAFIEDLGDFLKTGRSKLYGSDDIVGRWNFAKNASLRATKKNYVDVSSTEEMREIGDRMDRMDGVWAKAWPKVDGSVVRFYGRSQKEVLEEVLKALEKGYQEAIDNGEIEEEEDGGYDDGNYSQPVGFNETYGEGEEENDNSEQEKKAKLERTKKMMDWANSKMPGMVDSMIAIQTFMMETEGFFSRTEEDPVSEGSWSGTGSLFRLKMEGSEEKLSDELLLFYRQRPKGISLNGENVRANLNEEGRLHIHFGRDVLVFTRF
ncbi:MAG: hypothetical protein CMO65_06560 [Verrucomicrobiales bacterium]|nr:hypothetical protein [Verrucomicrobiales bacterium]